MNVKLGLDMKKRLKSVLVVKNHFPISHKVGDVVLIMVLDAIKSMERKTKRGYRNRSQIVRIVLD